LPHLRDENGIPFVIFLALLLKNYIKVRMKKHEDLQFNNVLANFFFIVNFFALQLMNSILQIFNCVQIGSDVVLYQEPSLSCKTPTWKGFVFFVIVFFVLYAVVLPWTVWKKIKMAKQSGDSDVQNLLVGTIADQYHHDCQWFEAFRHIIRFCFLFIRDIIPFASNTKIILLQITLIVNLLAESKFQPFRDFNLGVLSQM
jgi:hypothetical protein